MIQYSSTCGAEEIGIYDFEFENLQGDGSVKDDLMQVHVVMVSGEDDDGKMWYSWREDCDGGSSEEGKDFADEATARTDAKRHLAKMGG